MEDDPKSLTPEAFDALPSEDDSKGEAEKTAEESTPKKTEEATPPAEEKSETPKEQSVPYARFAKQNERVEKLEAEISALKQTKEERVLTDEEKQSLEAKNYLRNILKEVLAEEKSHQEAEEEKAVKDFEDESERLGSLYKDFDADKAVAFANKHDIKDLEHAYWRMKAEQTPSSEPPKPKLPKAPATTETLRKEVLEAPGKDIWGAVAAAKEKLGIR